MPRRYTSIPSKIRREARAPPISSLFLVVLIFPFSVAAQLSLFLFFCHSSSFLALWPTHAQSEHTYTHTHTQAPTKIALQFQELLQFWPLPFSSYSSSLSLRLPFAFTLSRHLQARAVFYFDSSSRPSRPSLPPSLPPSSHCACI